MTTKRAFREPIAVTLDWMWLDVAAHPHYCDILTVALRTAGQHQAERPFDLVDGWQIMLIAIGGRVEIFRPGEPVAMARSPVGAVPLPSGLWHRVRITDDGLWIRVYLEGPQIDRAYRHRPIVEAECVDTFPDRRIAVYNRERAGFADHESRIDNFKVERLRSG